MVANRPADSEPGSLAKRRYAEHFLRRYGKPRSNLDTYGGDFVQIEAHARQQPGTVGQVLKHVYRSFFDDDSQAKFGQHSPRTLAGKGFFMHVRGYAEGYEADRRVQLEREHSAKVHAKLEADEEQWRRERAESERMRESQGPMAEPMAEVLRAINGGKV